MKTKTSKPPSPKRAMRRHDELIDNLDGLLVAFPDAENLRDLRDRVKGDRAKEADRIGRKGKR